MDVFDLNRRLGRGVNIVGYDPLWKDRSKGRFQAKHMAAIAAAGLNHVRINLHAFGHMGDGPDFLLDPAWLETLDWLVDEALGQGLLVILDFHEFGAMGKDPKKHEPKMAAFWEQISERMKDRPEEVVFEILNEPHSALTPEMWNEMIPLFLSQVRRANPDRGVIVGPGHWNGIRGLPALDLPEDKGLILTVHYYLPMAFTHQGAAWAPEYPKVGVGWLGTDEEREAIRKDFAEAQAWASQRSLPVYLGEFGAYDKGDMASRVRYTDAVAREAEAFGWSWGCWQFDSDFLLWDMKKDDWVRPLLGALVPES